MRARGRKRKGWSDHEGFRLWFEGIAEPPGLIGHFEKLLAPLRLGDDTQQRLSRSRDGGLAIATGLVREFLSGEKLERYHVFRIVRRRLGSPADVESAMIALVQMVLGRDPAWDETKYRSQEDPAELSVQELLARTIGFAPGAGLVQGPRGQLLMGCDPLKMPESLAPLINANLSTSVHGAVVSTTDPVGIEDLNLASVVLHTFSTNAEAFMTSAELYYGRYASPPGSVHRLFGAFSRISVDRRPAARATAWIVVATALVLRAMIAAKLTQRESVFELLKSIEDSAAKCRAYIAIIEATPSVDRKYLVAGASEKLARLDKANPSERKRVSEQLNAYLAAHPEHCQTLGVWPPSVPTVPTR